MQLPLLAVAQSDSKQEIEDHWKWLESNLVAVLGKSLCQAYDTVCVAG